MNFKDLADQIASNALYVVGFLVIIVGLFVCSVIAERIIRWKEGITDKTSAARRAACVGVLAAISAVLMLFEIPMPFAPSFYKLDLSEIPVMIGAYAFGPSAGVLIEFIKIVLKLFMKGTSTAFVGELANFAVGSSFVIPAATLYYANKTKTTAIKSCVLGTICITLFGTTFNALYLLPAFAKLYEKVAPRLKDGARTCSSARSTESSPPLADCTCSLPDRSPGAAFCWRSYSP